jgi:hypothetical protein
MLDRNFIGRQSTGSKELRLNWHEPGIYFEFSQANAGAEAHSYFSIS